MRFRLLPTVHSQGPKSFNPSKIRGDIQPAPIALRDWWYLHSGDAAHFRAQNSQRLCLNCQACTEELFNGPHRKLSFCASNITVWICAGWGLSLVLSWPFPRWPWLMHFNSRKLSWFECTAQSKADIAAFVQNHKRKVLMVLIHA